MRLRTASGLALASLTFLGAVMVLESPGGHGGRASDTLTTTVLVIDNDTTAASNELTSWECSRRADAVARGRDLGLLQT